MFDDDEWSWARRAALKALLTLAVCALLWWIWEDRPSPIAPWQPPAKALRDYIDAARRHDCAAVVAALSQRSRELAATIPAGRANLEPSMNVSRANLERSMCDYTPAPAKLSEFETNRIRVQRASRTSALVSASFTYDRFFGFFGRGRARYTYALVNEEGAWRIDLTESLDPESRSNQNRRAMFLVQQVWMALHDHVLSTGGFTDNAEAIQAQLPGYKFPEIRKGVADANAPPEVLHVALASAHACISIKSASGTLVMVKAAPSPPQSTYQYGQIPSTCDDQPLARRYHGASSGIR